MLEHYLGPNLPFYLGSLAVIAIGVVIVWLVMRAQK